MSIRSYYRWALLLPLAVPLLAGAVTRFEGVPPLLLVIVYYLYATLAVGGVPYLVFATGFLLWSRGRSDPDVRRAVLLAPLAYTAVLVVCLVLFLAVDSRLSHGGDFLATASVSGILFGYAYVVLAALGRRILRPDAEPTLPLPAA